MLTEPDRTVPRFPAPLLFDSLFKNFDAAICTMKLDQKKVAFRH